MILHRHLVGQTSLHKRPGNPETSIGEPNRGPSSPATSGGAGRISSSVPLAAADEMDVAVAPLNPYRAAVWRAIIVVVKAILHPFRDIAVHVVQTKPVWSEGPDW